MEDAAPPVGLVKFARRALIFSVETGRSVPLRGLRIEVVESLKLLREVHVNPDQEEEAMASHAILR
jgi:hypothetical protein